MASPLFDAHNFLVVGKFKQAIQEAEAARPVTKASRDVTAFNEEKAWIVGQAQIQLQPDIGTNISSFVSNLFPRDATGTSSHPVVQALIRWARFTKATREAEGSVVVPDLSLNVEDALNRLLEPLVQLDLSEVYTAIFAVAALISVQDYPAALKKANEWTCQLTDLNDFKIQMQRLELHYLIIEALLRINRLDQAKAELLEMTKINDESVFTILASGIISLYLGQLNVSESAVHYNNAKNAFSGSIIRYGPSPMQLNFLALANMGLGNLLEAEGRVKEAMELTSSHEQEQWISVNHKALLFHKGGDKEIQTYDERNDSSISGSMNGEIKRNAMGWCATKLEMEKELERAVEEFLSSGK